MQSDSIVKNVLKCLCGSYGWSYGVFWSFDQPNSLFFTMQDAYYEKKLEGLIQNLRLQVPMLGGGIIGQAAFTKKHQWTSIDNPNTRQDFSNSICDMFVDDSEFNCQFSSGIKTVTAIPVEPQGVVQFGSTENIMETEEFVYQTTRIFQEIVNIGVQSCPPNESFTSLISSKDGYCSNFTGDDHNSIEPTCSSAFQTEPCFFGSKSEVVLPTQSNSTFMNNHHDLFDPLPDFGIPNEILQTDDFNPVNYEDKGEIFYGNDYSALGSREGLFSRLGIGELLEGISGTSSVKVTEGKVSSTNRRRKMGNSMWEMSSLQSVLNNSYNGYNMDCFSKVEPEMGTKKKAKRGTKPRPKDRQQILDRMAELRELIPNGDKMSIDCLLDRTIKHMLFLESVTKLADRIKQADEPKNKKDKDPRSSGVTWACELTNQTMVYPLIVEDLGTPGQMLIEMLCEENGFFLEMVDVIRGFGVTILKGVMEVRDKIWARFIVEIEAKRHVTRHEIFSALIQLLQVTGM